MADFVKYHDDGEVDLGPTITTLSLGADAEMTIRMKAKYFLTSRAVSKRPVGARAKAKGGKQTFEIKHDPSAPVPVGCQNYQERCNLASLYNDSRYRARYESALNELAKQTSKSGARNAPVVLNMRLKHGDMVVMHGEDLQRCFEVRFCICSAAESMKTRLISSITACGHPCREATICPDGTIHRSQHQPFGTMEGELPTTSVPDYDGDESLPIAGTPDPGYGPLPPTPSS